MGKPNKSYKNDDDIISIELGVSRRKLMRQLGAAGMATSMASLAGCSGLLQEEGDDDAAGDGTGDDGNGGGGDDGDDIPSFTRVPLVPPPTADELDLTNPQDPQRRMDFVVHHAANEFFVPVVAGMNDGLHKLGWSGEFIGPTDDDQERQVEILQTKVGELQGQRDVLATSIMDAESYVSPVEQAYENDLAVVCYNTIVDEWDFSFMMEQFGNVVPYVGQQAFPAGNAVGVTAYEKAQEMFGEDEALTVLPCIAVPGHPALQARTDGFVNSIGAQENVEMLEQLDISTDVSQATSRVADAYSANTDINVILGSGFWGPAAAAALMENQDLQGELVVGGFDLPESTIDGIQNGTITFTVGQDPYSQGYISTQLAYEYMDRGIPMKDYITGVSIIDENNIEFAAQRDGAMADLVSWQADNYEEGEAF